MQARPSLERHEHAARERRTEMPWMAARLKAKTGIDPLTIDQTECESPSETPSLAKLEDRMPPGAFDLVVAHPRKTFERGRPTWRLASGAQLVDLPAQLADRTARMIVEARFADEPADAVPVDRLLLWPGESIPLVLPPGEFRVSAYEEGLARRDELSSDRDAARRPQGGLSLSRVKHARVNAPALS